MADDQSQGGDSLQRQLGVLGPAPAGLDLSGLQEHGGGAPPDVPVTAVRPDDLRPPAPQQRQARGGAAGPSGLLFPARVAAATILCNEAFWAAHPEAAQGISDEGRLTYYLALAPFQHALSRPVDALGRPLYNFELLSLQGLRGAIDAERSERLADSNRAAARAEREAILQDLATIAPPEILHRIRERDGL